jgi:hypothetical protein
MPGQREAGVCFSRRSRPARYVGFPHEFFGIPLPPLQVLASGERKMGIKIRSLNGLW